MKTFNYKFIKYILVCLSFTIFSCSKNYIKTYESYNEYKILNPDEFLNKSNNDYLIYVYSEYCPPCRDLKNEVFNLLDTKPNNFYIYDVTNISDSDLYKFKLFDETKTKEEMKLEMINKSNIKDIYLVQTPSIYSINNKGLLTDVEFNYTNIQNIIFGLKNNK